MVDVRFWAGDDSIGVAADGCFACAGGAVMRLRIARD